MGARVGVTVAGGSVEAGAGVGMQPASRIMKRKIFLIIASILMIVLGLLRGFGGIALFIKGSGLRTNGPNNKKPFNIPPDKKRSKAKKQRFQLFKEYFLS